MTAAKFNELQQAFGINYNEHSLLFCDECRGKVLEWTRYDWMHNEVQQGTFSNEVRMFLRKLEEVNPAFNMDFFAEYFREGWHLDQYNPWRRFKSAEHGFKCSASEHMCVHMVLAQFVFIV